MDIFLHQVSFPGCCHFSPMLTNGERGFSLAATTWPRSHKAEALDINANRLPQASTEVQQKLGWSRIARVKGAGTRSAIWRVKLVDI